MRLSATLILKVTSGSLWLLWFWRLSDSYSSVFINPTSVTSAGGRFGQTPVFLLQDKTMRCSLRTLRFFLCRRSIAYSWSTRHLLSEKQHRILPQGRQSKAGRQSEIKRSFLTLCWAIERKQPRWWRMEPGRPSQRLSIPWGIWVSVCVTAAAISINDQKLLHLRYQATECSSTVIPPPPNSDTSNSENQYLFLSHVIYDLYHILWTDLKKTAYA